MKIRSSFAVILCKLIRAALRITGRGGTTLPGKVALRVCPDLLGYLAKDVKTVLVTGTNGKTTSSRMIEQALADAGASYFANRSGANLLSGITAEFAMNATLTGKPRREWAVIECDEAASKRVCSYVNPTVILVTNVFRDQLDRYGEVTHTLDNIRIGIQNAPNAVLCLNADCSLTASLADDVPNETVFYGVDTELYRQRVAEVSDATHCIRCGAEYTYDYVTYGHLGGFRCPACGYRRPAPQVSVTRVLGQTPDATDVALCIRGETVNAAVNLPGGYNVYNAVGAVTAILALGFPRDVAVSAISHFQCGFGRMERFELEGRQVRMILVKNPAGCNQVLNFLSNLEKEALFVICLNDKTADGTDVSWIWDVNFQQLCEIQDRLSGVLVSGVRADDMVLRLKYAGFPADKLGVYPDYGALLGAMLSQDKPVFVMPTYTAMLELREKIAHDYGYQNFWE
jgi:UDP-N-acetylmuramyl tripeptide synthase